MVDRVLERAREQQGSVLVIDGEAGIGKTALLESALTAAADLRPLRVAGREFEVDLAFAALHQLCVPLLDGIDQLPEAHRAALEQVFGLREGDVVDVRSVGLAVIGLLSAAKGDAPQVYVIDDVQWLDEESAQVLDLVARRVDGEQFALLLAVRDLAETRRWQGLPSLTLGPLAEDEARGLLAAEMRAPLDPRVLDRILAEAGGNPLALIELLRTVRPADLAGGYMLPDQRPTSSVIEASFRARLAALPGATQQLLLIAAAEPLGDLTVLWDAAELVGLPREAAAPAEDAELLDVGDRVTFSHPLVRSAIYRAASGAQRRTAHGALAEVTDMDTDPDRRAWHQAQAAHGPDEWVALALLRSATRARARGGVAAAAAFLERAASLTPDAHRRAQRMLDAAQAKHDAGAVDVAYTLLARAEDGPLDAAETAAARILRGRLAFTSGRGDAPDHLVAGAELLSELGSSQTREIYLEAFAAGLWVGRFAAPDAITRVARAVRAAPSATDPTGPLDLLLEGLAVKALEGHAAAVPYLRRAVDAFLAERLRPDETRWLWVACSVATYLWDERSWRALAERQVDYFRHDGILFALPIALHYRALAHVHAGEFKAAEALVDEAYAVAAAGGAGGVSCAHLLLSAWRGDAALTALVIEDSTQQAHTRREGRTLTSVELAAAVLHNGNGRYDAAFEAIAGAAQYDELGLQSYVPIELIEAAVRSGHRTVAAETLERLIARVDASGSRWAHGMALRSRALLAQDRQAEGFYREAIDALMHTDATPHLARVRLLYGEWLRRQGRRIDARSELRSAHEELTAIGAAGFAGRAARELRATGEIPMRRSGRAVVELTAQEVCIADRVSAGATTKEIASELFLSPRTVDAHLRNIFKKLGLVSRRELHGRQLSDLITAASANP